MGSLPSGADADITVRGPAGLLKHFTGSKTLSGVRPGRYTIAAGPVRGSKQDLYPPNVRQSVTVREGRTATASVDYVTVVPHTTKILDGQDMGLVGSSDGLTLTFAAGATAASSLRTGDVIAAGLGPQTPEGLLRKVTAVHRGDSGQIRVSTRKATLHEAVPRGRIEVRDAKMLSPSQARRGAATAQPASYAGESGTSGMRPVATLAGGEEEPDTTEIGGDGTFSFVHKTNGGEPTHEKDLGEGGDDSKGRATRECAWAATSPIVAQAMFKAQKPKMNFFAAWNSKDLASVRWTVSGAQSAGLNAGSTSSEAKCEGKWTYPIEPIQVAVVEAAIGPIPVVFTVNSQLVGGIGLAGKLSLKVKQNSQFSAGLDYRNGKTQGIHAFRNAFTLDGPPTFELEGSLKAGVRLSLKLYGVAGPYLDITPGVKLIEKDEIALKPGTAQLELRAGLYTAAGMDLEDLGFKKNAIEISDLYHQDKVLKTITWQESAEEKAAKERETSCPAGNTMTAAVSALDVSGDPTDQWLTGQKCWRDWAVADWVPNAVADRVSTTVFKRTGDRLTPALTMLASTTPAQTPKRTGQCTQLKKLHVPAGMLDYVCPSSTGTSARAPFNPASALVFKELGSRPTLSDSELKRLKGPLRAIQVCANCGPEGGDGSAQEVLLFYGNRYVGMVPEGSTYSDRSIDAQDGNTVTARVHWAKPDDPVCCPTGKTVMYHYVWRNHQLQWTTSQA
ncbi:LppP/LprE family lipoprotein [Streptomyces sp. NBC_01550]|uniref:LppP/LprE family lipoprotein n=1 Tax=Streptomyces sp. NBC_01550 TaxID=2975875 RepID=UPI00386B2E36